MSRRRHESERRALRVIVKTANLGAALLLASCSAASQTPPASAQASSVIVTDGDTLRIDGARVRLWGIDAPELHQTCATASGDATAPAGRLARDRLAQIVAGALVACEARDVDRYGRTVATCTANGADIGAAMVRDGLALDYAEYSRGAYSGIEIQAREARRGVWAMDCAAPSDFRRQHRRG